MPSVKVRENEPFEYALRRFKRSCEKAGVLAETLVRLRCARMLQVLLPGVAEPPHDTAGAAEIVAARLAAGSGKAAAE